MNPLFPEIIMARHLFPTLWPQFDAASRNITRLLCRFKKRFCSKKEKVLSMCHIGQNYLIDLNNLKRRVVSFTIPRVKLSPLFSGARYFISQAYRTVLLALELGALSWNIHISFLSAQALFKIGKLNSCFTLLLDNIMNSGYQITKITVSGRFLCFLQCLQ